MNKILQSLKLTFLHGGYAKLDTSWDYDNVISPFSRLYYITKGSGKMFHSYEEFDLKPGHLYLIPSFTYSRYRCYDHLEMYYIHFLEEVGDRLSIYDIKDFRYEIEASDQDLGYYKTLLTLHPKRYLIEDDPKIYDNRKFVSDTEKLNDLLSAKSFIQTQSLLQLLLSPFIQNSKSSKLNIKNDFHEVLNYIKEHLHEPLTVAQIAKHSNLSSDHFSRVFQQKFGIRPSKYIQTIRIERSETLLLTTNNTLAEIAEKTGMGTVSYLSRMFKAKNGITPGAFRKRRPGS
ncbi:AraC family transcriptional regulator [Zobellia galactanivorans]|uniref:AraC-type transcriptional regulator n=1 Tax=Zobellia galactanivorans (strain DSM 12802 / CCUG 47099 / CIP 106680 / NCIMB 13871 / Dsij) TaxID=63186 RepID=G0L4P8_ZOBGA|nr:MULTISPECIES: AraC family transcriptional regulator [Zobellia]MBU3025629.1 AraC family transcriptional regulator [Zobellia galactanivorans]MDO6808058.1 AraC family transcriptional regulator [Zobellia galactanivorans]OWW24951.1 AraC family transcriptional regulator [Zobellia sp. OII3]CAZ98827.1 AraC-type transcriptional regulator [Zobellia galactanivorans]